MFNETRLLDCVAYGSVFGQEFSTNIKTLRSGVERRNVNWSMPLGRYTVVYQALKPEDHVAVRGAHMACLGSAIPFRFKDWTDYRAEGEVIGTGTGAEQTLQLTKAYPFGPISLQRIIKKPVVGTVTLFADDAAIAASIDFTTGLATFTAPDGSVITWSGEFDVPVRFESDRLDVDPVARYSDDFALTADVDLVEVRL